MRFCQERRAPDLPAGNNPDILFGSLPFILYIIRAEHLVPNTKKIRVSRPSNRSIVTGLVKNNSRPGFGIGRKKKRKMRSVIHQLILYKKANEKYKNEDSIKGWLNFVKYIDDESYNQMSAYYEKIKALAK